MTWDNHGKYEKGKKKWQIDHIKPKSLFNFETPEDPEFKECWALENLQPLEAMENIKKGNKFCEI
jgi:5-methylcytosine-specific restriction endonuclease McrA